MSTFLIVTTESIASNIIVIIKTEENSIEINGKKYLKKEYTVHHKDMNRKNNKLSNLQVMTLKEHTSLHAKTRKK